MYHSTISGYGCVLFPMFRPTHVSTHLRVVLEGDFWSEPLDPARRQPARRQEEYEYVSAAPGSGGLAVTCLYLYRRPW